jgi:toxin ParE1/3/4
MNGRFVLSPRAQTECIKAVAARPAIGRECADLRPAYYKLSSGSHVLFYRLIAGGIDIVRILHERMDYDRHIP